tara:strand:+ start:350 stop:589 length:240 start_codon:yes stop_codon:yes gene_type:complete
MPPDDSIIFENPNELKFEDAVTQLNQIVDLMESSDVDLDKMIKNYQQGLSLLKFCQKKIQEAEFKLTELNSSNPEQVEN